MVFDKTGTLTRGQPELIGLRDHSSEDLALAGALAQASAHPLARALSEAVQQVGIATRKVKELKEVPGHGVEGHWEGQVVRLGRAEWLGESPKGSTATYLRVGDATPVAFEFSDSLRDGAEVLVAALKTQGKDVILLSGDVPAAVAEVADRVGIDAWDAQMLPTDKAARIAMLAKTGRKVLMVGDGLNDTAALAAAHVSISPASALEAARVVSDIVLLGNTLGPIADAMDTAKAATRRIKENFAIAVLYNMIAVPIALAGLATPLAAALAMSGSSISVSLNSLRLVRR